MKRVSAAVAAAVLAATVALAAACGPSGPRDSGLSVVAGFYPLQFVAERVGGDRVTVANLTQPGAEPHDLELSPRQMGTITDAALVVYVRGFQPALDEAVDRAGVPAMDAASLVPAIEAVAADHGGQEASKQHAETEGAQPADPHVWLDPMRLATIADALATRLAELDGADAEGYRARAAALRTELTALDGEFAEGLRDCQRREIVVSHAAFGYLADRYDLHQIPITGLAPETEPTPGQLASAAQAAREVGATTIFFETLVSPAVAEAVADAIGAGTAVLDPIEGLQPGTDGDYVSVMRDNLATLRPALGCA